MSREELIKKIRAKCKFPPEFFELQERIQKAVQDFLAKKITENELIDLVNIVNKELDKLIEEI